MLEVPDVDPQITAGDEGLHVVADRNTVDVVGVPMQIRLSTAGKEGRATHHQQKRRSPGQSLPILANPRRS
eukprot:5624412-Prorocentrum_lima.AAC.1